MIADDSDAKRMVLKDIIMIGRHECASEAANGLEAVEQFQKIEPDLVLLDMAMPKKDGLAVLREIIRLKPEAKVIIITATDNQSVIKQCISDGAAAYILKPFNFEEVLRTMNRVLSS